jgi:hypothetical protein
LARPKSSSGRAPAKELESRKSCASSAKDAPGMSQEQGRARGATTP